MKKFIAVIALLVLVLTCSGCSLNLFSVDSLITPPEQSGKNGQVQKAFNSLMKDTKVQLKTPVYGEYQTSFVLLDINNDGVEEAFVFYTDSSSAEGSVRMAFMECVDDDWFISSDIKGAGNGVYDVEFVDLNRDGYSEVLVSWSLLDSKTTRIVSVFEIADGGNHKLVLNSLGNEYCNAKTVLDFNNDGADDLLLIYLDDTGAVQKSFLRMFTLNANNQMIKYGETVLDSAIASISTIQSDIATIGGQQTVRLFVDCAKNDRTIFTEGVYWDSRLLVPTRLFTEPSVTNLRNSLLTCKDIDNDGLLEIPTTTKLYGDENTLTVKTETDMYTLSLLLWEGAPGDNNHKSFITLLNPLDYYLFIFEWGSSVTVKYDSLREALIFCEWNEEEKKTGDELFSITHRESLAENEILGELLAETEKGVYYYQITEKGIDFGITDEIVSSSFIKIN